MIDNLEKESIFFIYSELDSKAARLLRAIQKIMLRYDR